MFLKKYLIFKLLLVAISISCSQRDEHTAAVAEKREENNSSWQFIVTGDCRSGSDGSGVNTEILDKVARAVSKEDIKFVLSLFDFIVLI